MHKENVSIHEPWLQDCQQSLSYAREWIVTIRSMYRHKRNQLTTLTSFGERLVAFWASLDEDFIALLDPFTLDSASLKDDADEENDVASPFLEANRDFVLTSEEPTVCRSSPLRNVADRLRLLLPLGLAEDTGLPGVLSWLDGTPLTVAFNLAGFFREVPLGFRSVCTKQNRKRPKDGESWNVRHNSLETVWRCSAAGKK